MSRSSSLTFPLVPVIAGGIVLLVIVAALALGLHTPTAPVTPYEKAVNVTSH